MSGSSPEGARAESIAAARTAAAPPGVMRLDETSDLWWKNAIVYCVDVKTFLDFDGDGFGDLPGLTHRIDHLAGLGVTCLWLMPFYPSPRRDDGYDITDFYSVDPRLGSLGDFARVVRVARDRGMRVIIDLVASHTSDLHPWFRQARADPDSPFRGWYVWRDFPPAEPTEIVFPGEEDSAWEFDEAAGQYYLHHFLASQPDLNLANPAVRDEMVKVMGFWLSLGVSGFRVDAVPYLLEDRENAHELVRAMRAFMTRRFGEGVLLGEANLLPPSQLEFFGAHGDELSMQFNFSLNGEEIGLRENLAVPSRLANRPPMQWSAEEHAGFSPPGARDLIRPVRRGERRRPAARPRIAAELDGAADPPPAGVPGDRVGPRHAARHGPRRLRAPLRLARRDPRRRAQPLRPERHRRSRPGRPTRGRRAARPARRRGRAPVARAGDAARPRDLRLPLAADPPGRPPHPPLVPTTARSCGRRY
jgi:hypothetical protein